jgi:hypothetical protein
MKIEIEVGRESTKSKFFQACTIQQRKACRIGLATLHSTIANIHIASVPL